MFNRRRIGLLTAAVAAVAVRDAAARPGGPLTFDFTLNPAASGLAGTMDMSVDTSGTLIGNWSAKNNPTGTRTKPGLFGTFGPTENVPVPTTLGAGVGGPVDTQAAGSLRLELDPAAGSAMLAGLDLDFLAGGTFLLPATVDIAFGSFRTRAPDSIYPGVPVSLPIGDVSVTALTGVLESPAPGTLTPTGPDEYDVTIPAVILLAGSFEVLGSATELPPTPVPIVLQVHVAVAGSSAAMSGVQPVVVSQSQEPGTKLPEFPLDLPTVLPPGATAHLLMNLVLDAISVDVDASLSLAADGVLAPGCYPDCSGDGTLTIADFGCFQTKFVQGDPYADCNSDGVLTIADFGCFQTKFVAGCP